MPENLATLYETWSEFLQLQGRYTEANAILEKLINLRSTWLQSPS